MNNELKYCKKLHPFYLAPCHPTIEGPTGSEFACVVCLEEENRALKESIIVIQSLMDIINNRKDLINKLEETNNQGIAMLRNMFPEQDLSKDYIEKKVFSHLSTMKEEQEQMLADLENHQLSAGTVSLKEVEEIGTISSQDFIKKVYELLRKYISPVSISGGKGFYKEFRHKQKTDSNITKLSNIDALLYMGTGIYYDIENSRDTLLICLKDIVIGVANPTASFYEDNMEIVVMSIAGVNKSQDSYIRKTDVESILLVKSDYILNELERYLVKTCT